MCRVTELHSLYFVTCTYLCILSYQKNRNCTEVTQVFLFHFLVYTHPTNILYLQFSNKYGKTESNYGLPYLFLSFYVTIFSLKNGLI